MGAWPKIVIGAEAGSSVLNPIQGTEPNESRVVLMNDGCSRLSNLPRIVLSMAIIGYAFGRFAFSGLGFNLILALILLVTNFLFLHQFTLL